MKFRMVDQIISWESRRSIRGIKTVSFEEYCAKAAFADEEQLPQTLALQSLFELGSWLIVLSSDFTQMALPVALEQVAFDSALRPAQRMEIDVALRGCENGDVIFGGIGRVGDRPVVTARSWVAQPCDLCLYHDPDDLRVLFSEIHRPLEGGLP
jgi:3-hydroxymyristoyl/3-hydroxydecanoyl-(acyl carrier protein) dehydratase